MKVALAWIDWSDPTDRAVVLGLSRALRARGHRCFLVGPRRKKGQPFRSRVAGLTLYRIDGAAAQSSRQLSEIERTEKPDLWHCHVFGRTHTALSSWTGERRAPLVVTLHLVLADYLRFAGGKAGLRRLLKGAQAATTVSKASHREFISLFPEWRGRAAVVYNGSPEPRAAAAPKKARRPFILCVGRLAPYKGQDLLLMAFAQTALALPGWRLVLAGRDQTSGGMKTLSTALGLEGRVDFLGEVSPRRVTGLLETCSLFVLPSRRENFPLAVLEAMRAGAPVLAADVGGVRELICDKRTGSLFPAGDVPSLARKMTALCVLPERRRALSGVGRRRAQEFSWDRAVAAFDEIYTAVSV